MTICKCGFNTSCCMCKKEQKETFDIYFKKIMNEDNGDFIDKEKMDELKQFHDDSLNEVIAKLSNRIDECKEKDIKIVELQKVCQREDFSKKLLNDKIAELQAENEVLKQAHKDYVNKIINTFGSD